MNPQTQADLEQEIRSLRYRIEELERQLARAITAINQIDGGDWWHLDNYTATPFEPSHNQ